MKLHARRYELGKCAPVAASKVADQIQMRLPRTRKQFDGALNGRTMVAAQMGCTPLLGKGEYSLGILCRGNLPQHAIGAGDSRHTPGVGNLCDGLFQKLLLTCKMVPASHAGGTVQQEYRHATASLPRRLAFWGPSGPCKEQHGTGQNHKPHQQQQEIAQFSPPLVGQLRTKQKLHHRKHNGVVIAPIQQVQHDGNNQCQQPPQQIWIGEG